MVSNFMYSRGWKDDVPRPKKCRDWVEFWSWNMGKPITENVICIETRWHMEERHLDEIIEEKNEYGLMKFWDDMVIVVV